MDGGTTGSGTKRRYRHHGGEDLYQSLQKFGKFRLAARDYRPMGILSRGLERLAGPLGQRLSRPPKREKAADALEVQLTKVVEESALGLLDADRIEAIAYDSGAFIYKRVVHPGVLGCALVLSSLMRQTDTSGRWLDAQSVYVDLGGAEMSRTSFRDAARRMKPTLTVLLRRRLAQLAADTDRHELRGRLEAFADVIIPDGCAFKLASVLSGVHPGTGNPAELKLHAVYSVRTGMVSTTTTAGRVHDNDGFWPKWERGALYIWDLGYNDMKRFIDAMDAGAHVLQRLKTTGNPKALARIDADGTRHTEGMPATLAQACELFSPPTGELDFEVEIKDADGRRRKARVVCVPYAGEDRYYLTTLPREVFTPSDCAELYRVRWEVELFFRNWHGALRMDDVHRLRHPVSLEVAILSSLLAACLSREVHAGLERLVPDLVDGEDPPSPVAAAAFPPSGLAAGREVAAAVNRGVQGRHATATSHRLSDYGSRRSAIG